MKKIMLLAIGLIFLCTLSAQAETYQYPGGIYDGKDLYTYVGTTDLEIKVSWTPVLDAESYDLELYCVDRNVNVAQANTPTAGLTIKAPHQGLFIVRVRAVRTPPTGPQITSEWVSTDDPTIALVDGKPRGWWIYSFLAPPGPIQ